MLWLDVDRNEPELDTVSWVGTHVVTTGHTFEHDEDGRRVGRLTAHRDGDVWRLASLEVDVSYRRRGIGTALVFEALRWCDGPVELRVSLDNPALRVYHRLGFRPVEVRDGYLVMRCEASSVTAEG